jgi:predicted nucleic acid-binding protein
VASCGKRHPVALIADSSGIYALYDKRDKHHRAVREVVGEEQGRIVIPTMILAEVDFLLRTRLGVDAEIRFLEGLSSGAFTLEEFTGGDALRCQSLLERYRDLDLGLADAAVIAAAERLKIPRVLTLDVRDFRTVRTSLGEPLILLPADRTP